MWILWLLFLHLENGDPCLISLTSYLESWSPASGRASTSSPVLESENLPLSYSWWYTDSPKGSSLRARRWICASSSLFAASQLWSVTKLTAQIADFVVNNVLFAETIIHIFNIFFSRLKILKIFSLSAQNQCLMPLAIFAFHLVYH